VRTADDIYEDLVNRMPAQFVDPKTGAIGPNLGALIRAIATEMVKLPVTQEQAERIGQALKTVSGELKDVDKRLRQIEASRHGAQTYDAAEDKQPRDQRPGEEIDVLRAELAASRDNRREEVSTLVSEVTRLRNENEDLQHAHDEIARALWQETQKLDAESKLLAEARARLEKLRKWDLP
jgi:chromosome segregation ATPase